MLMEKKVRNTDTLQKYNANHEPQVWPYDAKIEYITYRCLKTKQRSLSNNDSILWLISQSSNPTYACPRQ